MEKPLKVLAIGNSFSVDGMQWLYDIAADYGIKIVLGNLYIGGCSLSTHWSNASTNAPAYGYYKNRDGEWIQHPDETLIHGIKDEDWDIITLQQVSSNSGEPDTYDPYLTDLIDYVNSNKTNPNAKLGWQMTWAYPQNSASANFARYNNDQMTMYNAIINAVKEKIVNNSNFSYIIPSGTAIQNVRTSYIGDILNRDDIHLTLNLGRYIAGMAWFKALTGLPIDNINYVPDTTEIPIDYLEIIKEAVNAAIENPFTVTNSSYTTK